MIEAIRAADAQRLRDIVAARFGLHFEDARLGFLAEVLERRAAIAHVTPAHYLNAIAAGSHELLHDLGQHLTVSETYFFRNIEQLNAFAEVALPDRMSTRHDAHHLRILSAGCASGEEPYSLAMLLRERITDPSWRVSLRGVDLSATVLAKAVAGRYSAWSLRETTPEIKHRWFTTEGRDFVLAKSIRDAVSFEERNLSLEDPSLWLHETYDVVFCRNVVMYFEPEAARRLIARITRSLLPGGYLFLGHAETLRGLSHDFHLRHTHGAFYYSRKDARELAEARSSTFPPPPPSSWSPDAGVADSDWTSTWIDTVQRASARIRSLAANGEAPSSARAVTLPESKKAKLDVALDLLKKERFAEALTLLRELPVDVAQDPDALLLGAVLLTHSGQVEHAEKMCARLLEIDDLSAGAHYVLALCRENAGDLPGAFDQDQIAAYLDPTFAMPRLHLGLMARRANDHAAAQRETEQAALLLQREDTSHLLLFGGGFNRDGLIALCRAELGKLGGTR